jgi:hypothetical protein
LAQTVGSPRHRDIRKFAKRVALDVARGWDRGNGPPRLAYCQLPAPPFSEIWMEVGKKFAEIA